MGPSDFPIATTIHTHKFRLIMNGLIGPRTIPENILPHVGGEVSRAPFETNS